MAARKLYFLPKGVAPYLLEVLDKMNTETIAKTNKEIQKFTQGNEYFGIIQLLHKHGLDTAALSQANFTIRDFAMDILPIDFGYSIDVDDFYAQKTRIEHKKGLEALRRQIEDKHKQYVAEMMQDVLKRLTPIIVAKSYRGLKVKQKLSGLIDICEGAGLVAISEEVLQPLMEICAARTYAREELVEKYFGTKDLLEGVEKAMRELKTPFLEEQ